MNNSDNFLREGYYIAIYCCLSGTRPNVYRRLIGVLDFQEKDLNRLNGAMKAAAEATRDRSFCIGTERNPFINQIGFKYRDVPVAPYAPHLIPARQLHDGVTKDWLDNFAEPVEIGPLGVFGAAYIEKEWPRLYEYAQYMVVGAGDYISRLDGCETYSEHLRSVLRPDV